MSFHMPENAHVQGGWQDPVIRELTAFFQQDPAVLSLALGGSGARNPTATDAWSDIDLLVVVRDEALARYFPALDWLDSFGDIFAYEQYAHEFTKTTRVCFFDFKRFDLIFTTSTALSQIDDWSDNFVWQRRETLFSQQAVIEAALDQTPLLYQPSALTPEQFATMVNGFWFKAIVAASKLVRQDWLIALHLTLDLARDCLVMGMVLRDRAGGDWNHVVGQIEDSCQPYTVDGMLASLAASGRAFDQLAQQWSPQYRPRGEAFAQWLSYTQCRLSPGS